MGYWYSINDADFRIPFANVDEAFRRVRDQKNADGFVSPTPFTLPELLKQVGFTANVDEATGDVVIWGGNSKYGFRFPFIAVLGDLVPNGSYVIWRGEEGADFVRQIVIDGEVREQRGTVTFA